MPAPVLLIVIGTRSEVLAGASLIQTLRSANPLSLPFEARVVTTGQEDTELRQALDITGIVPDTFKEDAEVVLKGRLASDGSFHVDKDGVMAKCPSKYEAAKKVG